MENLNTLCYLKEQTSFMEDYDGKFGYQVHDKGNRFYVTFEAVLQSFGSKNRNGRIYNARNIMERIKNDEYIQDQLRKNSWMGEIDHPSSAIQGHELTMQRIANPDMSRTSHYIRSPRLNGNMLEANIQTDSSNSAGMNMAIKIVDGKITPCFSARVLGSLDTSSDRPTVNVRKLITYDWVLFPSHKEAEAKINQPLQESKELDSMGCNIIYFDELAKIASDNKETELLYESFGITPDDAVGLTEDGRVVLEKNSNIFIQPISDRIIRNKVRKSLIEWIKDN